MTTGYETLIVTFCDPIRILDGMFGDDGTCGVSTLKEWLDSYESTRATPIDGHTMVITSDYNMSCVKEWLRKNTSATEMKTF